jgi:hypothetical protein
MSPDLFNGMPLTPEEQAKVDILRTNWRHKGAKAMEAFIKAEPVLTARAVKHRLGPEGVRNLFLEELGKRGVTIAEFERLLKRKPH